MVFLTIVLIGFLSGLLGGLLGIGGSIVMIPAMTAVCGPAQHIYQGAGLILSCCVALPAAYQHFRADAVLRPVVRVTIPASVLGVLTGVWLSAGWWFGGTNEGYLSQVFGLFLLYQAGYNVYRLFSSYRLPDISEIAAEAIPRWKAAVVGVCMGLVAGLLGVGGGIVAVPLQQVLLRMPLRRAIANSAVSMVLLSLVGAVHKNCANYCAGLPWVESVKLAISIVPTAMIGGFLGGWLTHVVPRRALRVAVVMLMCYGGVTMLRREPHRVPARAASQPFLPEHQRSGP
jgi:uncharacterized protein